MNSLSLISCIYLFCVKVSSVCDDVVLHSCRPDYESGTSLGPCSVATEDGKPILNSLNLDIL